MLVWLITALLRLILPLLVFIHPLIGTGLGLLSDFGDVVVLDFLNAPNLTSWYNQFDKLFDLYLYGVLCWYGWKHWSNHLVKKTLVGLLLFRGGGVLVYELFPARWLLLVFPNVFIWFYLFQLVSLHVFKKDVITSYRRLTIILVVLTIPKLYQEYLFHVVQIPLYQWFITVLQLITG